MSKKKKSRHDFAHHIITSIWVVFKCTLVTFFWLTVAGAGYLAFKKLSVPISYVGLGVVGLGLLFAFSELWVGILSLFTRKYNKRNCVICDPD